MPRSKSRSGSGPLHKRDLAPSLCLTPSTAGVAVTRSQTPAFPFQIEEAARDLARLRRQVDGDYGLHLVERLADRIDCIDCIVQPSAGELHRSGLAVDDALRV